MDERTTNGYYVDMRLIMLLIIGLAIGGGILYVFSNNQVRTQEKIQVEQNNAKEATDQYRKNQAEMMIQLGQ